jgi:hypothetical protein
MRPTLIGLAASGCLIGLAACGASGTGSQASAVGTAQPTATSTVPPTAAPTPTPLSAEVLGAPVTTTDGLIITALGYKAHISSNNPYNTPPPGGYFAAGKVRECAGLTAITAAPTDWVLIASDQSQIPASYSAALVNLPGPELSSTSLNPGQCVAGWIEFDVPQMTTPTQISIKGANYYWTIG